MQKIELTPFLLTKERRRENMLKKAKMVFVFFLVASLFCGLPAEAVNKKFTESFKNTEDQIVYDLHVEFVSSAEPNDAVVNDAKDLRDAAHGGFQKVSKSGNSVDLEKGSVKNGKIVEVSFDVSGTFPLTMTWQWTDENGYWVGGAKTASVETETTETISCGG